MTKYFKTSDGTRGGSNNDLQFQGGHVQSWFTMFFDLAIPFSLNRFTERKSQSRSRSTQITAL